MPFGNTENLGQKCKTRRQLKAEEQLRRQQEEEDEREQRAERERRKMRRQEKRNRNRTMSLSNSNRNQFDSCSSINKTEINSLENQNIIEKNVMNLTNTENFSGSNKITTEIENIEILTKASDMKSVTTDDTNTEKTGGEESINKENEEMSQSERERERDTSWQTFGAEYNEFGELISCGKEPLGKKDGFLLDYEKRDRSNAFWQVGEEYEGLVDGYGNRIDTIGINRGRWDNVQRGPLLHTSQNPDFVPDRFVPPS